MSEQALNLTASQLKDIISAAVAEAVKPNPLEQRKLDEELAKDKRRIQSAIALAKAEADKEYRHKHGCSHMRDGQTGNSVPRGSYGGVWVTSGQVHGNGTITIICQRCSNTWNFKATPQELEYANNAEHGLLGFAPPAEERVLQPA